MHLFYSGRWVCCLLLYLVLRAISTTWVLVHPSELAECIGTSENVSAIRGTVCCSHGMSMMEWSSSGLLEAGRKLGKGVVADSVLTPLLLLHPQAITALAPQQNILRTVLGGTLTSFHAWWAPGRLQLSSLGAQLVVLWWDLVRWGVMPGQGGSALMLGQEGEEEGEGLAPHLVGVLFQSSPLRTISFAGWGVKGIFVLWEAQGGVVVSLCSLHRGSAGPRWWCNLSNDLAFPPWTRRPSGLWAPALPMDPHSGPGWDCVPCPGDWGPARCLQRCVSILSCHLQWHLCSGACCCPGAPGAAAHARLGCAGCLWCRAGCDAAGGPESGAKTHPGEWLQLHLPRPARSTERHRVLRTPWLGWVGPCFCEQPGSCAFP